MRSCLSWPRMNWAVARELDFSYYIGESLLNTTSTHYGNLI